MRPLLVPFCLNDAAVFCRDLRFTDGQRIGTSLGHFRPVMLDEAGVASASDFIAFIKDLHVHVRLRQHSFGYPGARTIVVADGRESFGSTQGPLDVLQLNMAFVGSHE